MTLLEVPAVPRGTGIRVVSPASYAQPDKLAQGMEAVRHLGFEPSLGKAAQSKADHYFAGTHAARVDDLHAAFLDPAVSAILCSRGGYGSNYLLPHLDLGLIREHPKPFLAHSDMTSMQTWMLDQIGLPAFHGPMVAGDFGRPGGVDEASLISAFGGEPYSITEAQGLRMLRPGKATGTLYGGCLTLLAAALGTPYAPQMEGKLLFLEDRDTKPYQLDRLLRQLLLAGKFEGVTGIIFGEMVECVSPGQAPEVLQAVILRVLGDIAVPIGFGLRSGHVTTGNVTLAFGVQAELDLTAAPVLSFLESATKQS